MQTGQKDVLVQVPIDLFIYGCAYIGLIKKCVV